MNLSRQELYERVWSRPTVAIAAELGISDVALGKHCKKLNVPKPPLGYWAKVAAGQAPPKTPLPREPEPVKFEPLDSVVPSSLPLFEDRQVSHALAVELRAALRAAKPAANQIIKLEGPNFPLIAISKPLIDRATQAFEAILVEVEKRGVSLHRLRSKYEVAHLMFGGERLNLTIEEVLVDRELTKAEQRRPAWQWERPKVPTGKLSFAINPERHAGRTQKIWTESESLPLDGVLSKVVQGIFAHYAKLEREHVATRERNRIQHERWLVQEEAERKQQHVATLEVVTQSRKNNLLRAAEWWRLCREAMDFVGECEQRWREQQASDLTVEQLAWLDWARETAKAMSPFELGYPDPADDGAFDAEAIPLGGPYPENWDFSPPPTMPEIPTPSRDNGHSGFTLSASKAQFPFWLKYPRR